MLDKWRVESPKKGLLYEKHEDQFKWEKITERFSKMLWKVLYQLRAAKCIRQQPTVNQILNIASHWTIAYHYIQEMTIEIKIAGKNEISINAIPHTCLAQKIE